ncbi:hypothetical protein BDW67DRAFT_44533 [Aspergillus spinulosporus]
MPIWLVLLFHREEQAISPVSRLSNYYSRRSVLTSGHVIRTRRELYSGCESSNETLLDYERFKYFVFFGRSDAGGSFDQHFFTLPTQQTLWVEHVGPIDAVEAWLLQVKEGPEARYVTESINNQPTPYALPITTRYQRHFGTSDASDIMRRLCMSTSMVYSMVYSMVQSAIRNISEQDVVHANLGLVLSMSI